MRTEAQYQMAGKSKENSEVYGTWIDEVNLAPLLDILARMCGATLDSDDFLGIRTALAETEYEKDRWWGYDLVGEYTISLRLAVDREADYIIFVRVSAPPEHGTAITVALDIANCYTLTHDPPLFQERD